MTMMFPTFYDRLATVIMQFVFVAIIELRGLLILVISCWRFWLRISLGRYQSINNRTDVRLFVILLFKVLDCLICRLKTSLRLLLTVSCFKFPKWNCFENICDEFLMVFSQEFRRWLTSVLTYFGFLKIKLCLITGKNRILELKIKLYTVDASLLYLLHHVFL